MGERRMVHGEIAGVRRAITWLHDRAKEMNDQHARAILNVAATDLGRDLSRWQWPCGEPARPGETEAERIIRRMDELGR